MSNRGDIKKALLSCLRANLKGHNITEATLDHSVDAYLSALEDIDRPTLEAAVIYYISTATFFPTPGDIRNAALELKLMALGIPTASEAWAQVLKARRYEVAQNCDEGLRFYDDVQDAEGYWATIQAANEHKKTCKVCTKGRQVETYESEAVRSTVDLMGGLGRVLTGNPVSDRARFQEGYREVVEREKKLFAMPSVVRGYIESTRQNTITGSIKNLSERMKTNGSSS